MRCSPQKKVRTGRVEAITCPVYSNLRIPATVSYNGLYQSYSETRPLPEDCGDVGMPLSHMR
jgi:hypothetical protein